MEMAVRLLILLSAYLLGSIPTALIVSRKVLHADIRTLGDGNMGARNSYHVIGPRYGYFIAIVDFLKGALPVFLAQRLGLSLGFQMLAGLAVVAGHDFPVFAGMRGGQGTAAALGTMSALFPLPTFAALSIFGLSFPVARNFDISMGLGCATMAAILLLTHQYSLLAYAVAVLLTIPAKKLIDTPRRREIETAK